ncbi:transposase [Pandoraea sputorum]
MKKNRYSDEQILRILREADRDTVPEVAKRHGMSEASISLAKALWRDDQ